MQHRVLEPVIEIVAAAFGLARWILVLALRAARLTDHAVRNVGDSELVYVVVETYPEGYLPDEPTWDSHIEALQKRYDAQA